MARRRNTAARKLVAILRRPAFAEDGSFLVEAVVGSLIIVVVGLGVLELVDRSARLGGQQEAQAVAGNVAQSEQEQVRALPPAEQSNLRRTTTRTIDGVAYTIATRADWVTDSSGDADCTTTGATADYMRLSTVVTWPQMSTRRPVTLESLITPGVRSFTAAQGSLAVQVTDRNGVGVGGLQLNLGGPTTLSDATSSSGCVLWGYLPAGSGYAVSFSRPPDYVTPDGSTNVGKPVAVVGEQTSNVALQYDRGGRLRTRFVTKRVVDGEDIATSPQVVHVTHSGGGGVSVQYPVTGSEDTSGLLFPFSSPYTVQADSCSLGDVPPMPQRPDPEEPDPPAPVTGTVLSGTTTTTATLRIPSPNIKVVNDSGPLAGATVKVKTPCGTEYERRTTADGTLADPGFPYTTLAICATDGTRRVEMSRANRNFNNSRELIVRIASTSTPGTCP